MWHQTALCPWQELKLVMPIEIPSQITSQHGKSISTGFLFLDLVFVAGTKHSVVWFPSDSGIFCIHLLGPRVVLRVYVALFFCWNRVLDLP